MRAEGQDLGHPPVGLGWAELLDAWREQTGGWTALAEELVRRVGRGADVPRDLGSVERGLRRLARRGHDPGGQYGRWVARYLGVPTPIDAWLRWLGQYHHRFADLPVSLRRAQLMIWDRPPVSETAASVWIDLGMAAVAMRSTDPAGVRARISHAAPRAAAAGTAAQLELGLLCARVASDEGDTHAEEGHLAFVESRLSAHGAEGAEITRRQGAPFPPDGPPLGADDAACYRARAIDARAYRLSHPFAGGPDHLAAEARYRSIAPDSGLPFVDFRRAMGLGYCAWKLGDSDAGTALALEAAEHAADGGFVRLRVMAVNLASRAALTSTTPRLADRLRARAARLADLLDDDELRARVRKP